MTTGELLVPSQPGAVTGDYRELLLSGKPLIDVRAPVEFDKGSFPESVNLPLMNDEERHLVGIRYKESGQQSAIELGAKLLSNEQRAERVGYWIKFAEQNPDCALYCFRGGLRSRIAQQWLLDAGVEVPLIKGGYKALRSFLIDTLNNLCQQLSIVLIGGRTGNGKTLLIKRLHSTIDLEKMANHRGSSFGGMAGGQPSNIDFENAVAIQLLNLHDSGVSTVYLEDEARLIGRVCLPDVLRHAMHQAPIYILECDMEQRVKNCFDDYVTDLLNRYVTMHGEAAGFKAYAEHHRNSLARIRKRFGGENYNHACALLEKSLHQHLTHNDTSGYEAGIRLLLSEYYDPMYDYQLSNKQDRILFKGTADQIVRKATQS